MAIYPQNKLKIFFLLLKEDYGGLKQAGQRRTHGKDLPFIQIGLWKCTSSSPLKQLIYQLYVLLRHPKSRAQGLKQQIASTLAEVSSSG